MSEKKNMLFCSPARSMPENPQPSEKFEKLYWAEQPQKEEDYLVAYPEDFMESLRVLQAEIQIEQMEADEDLELEADPLLHLYLS